MNLKLKDILPNPFRDLKSNPLIEEKIEELVGSINLTGFWDNVVVRINSNNKPELAYGHHRLAAAIRAKITEADFIVKDLSDAMMIQIMDSENRETYGSTPLSLIESVRAVVSSLAKGTIAPFVVDSKTNTQQVRYAPSFIPGIRPQVGDAYPYTALNVAAFLGRTKKKGGEAENCIVAALNALHLKEAGHFSDDLLMTKDRTGAKVPITTNELLRITSDIKRDVEHTEVVQTKSRAEVNTWVNKQKELEEKRKAHEEAARLVQQALLKKQLDAKAEEDEKEIKRLGERMREQAANARLKAIADSEKLQALEQKVAAAKLKAEEAKKVDEYASVRRDVERFLFKLSNVSTGSICEEVKTLSRLPLNVNDRERLRQASLTLGTWYCEWVAAQFVPPLNGKKELKEMKSREVANRKAEEAKARAAEEIARKERVAAKAVAAKAAKAAKKKETK